jgi:hypothetical protein
MELNDDILVPVQTTPPQTIARIEHLSMTRKNTAVVAKVNFGFFFTYFGSNNVKCQDRAHRVDRVTCMVSMVECTNNVALYIDRR